MTTKKLIELNPGDRFMYGGVEWVILDRGVNMFCLAADVLETRVFDKDGKNNFGQSTLCAYLNGEFLPKLVAAGASETVFAEMLIDLTADDGLDDYGLYIAKIGLISCDQYRRFRKVIPDTSGWWWTCTPWSCKYSNNVRYVNSDGMLSNLSASNGFGSVRPFCCLISDVSVEVSGDDDKAKTKREEKA
jgi:hypothetical protein